MERETLSVSFPAEKLEALRFYMGEKGLTVEGELDEYMDQLYEKQVRQRHGAILTATTFRPNKPLYHRQNMSKRKPRPLPVAAKLARRKHKKRSLKSSRRSRWPNLW